MDLNIYHKIVNSEVSARKYLKKNVEKMSVDFVLAVTN